MYVDRVGIIHRVDRYPPGEGKKIHRVHTAPPTAKQKPRDFPLSTLQCVYSIVWTAGASHGEKDFGWAGVV